MIQIKQTEFFEIISTFDSVPYTQSYGWFCFNNCDETGLCDFFTDDIANPQIAVFGHVKKAFGLKMLLVEGECLKSLPYKSSLIKNFFEQLTFSGYDIVEFVSNSEYNSEFEVGIRRAGFLRPVGLFSMSLSKVIDLTSEILFDRNWNRNLKKSEAFNLEYREVISPDIQFISEMVNLYNKFSDQKGFSHKLSVNETSKVLQSPGYSVSCVDSTDGTLLSFMIYYLRNGCANSVFTAKSEKAKECGATFYLYKMLFEDLKKKGVKSYDIEKLVPSKHSTDSVFLFKDGMKGKRVIYNGEWSWYKYPFYRTIMYFVKKYIFKKRET
jgi:hypothetical protein